MLTLKLMLETKDRNRETDREREINRQILHTQTNIQTDICIFISSHSSVCFSGSIIDYCVFDVKLPHIKSGFCSVSDSSVILRKNAFHSFSSKYK